MPTSPPPASGFEEPADLEEHRIWAQVAAPTDTDPGAIIEASYTFQDGVVRVYDLDGNLIGTEHLSPDANAAAVARQVLRAKKSPGFWAPINYTTH